MRLGGEIDDGVALRRERVDKPRVADVAVDESIARPAFELDEIGQVAGVGELVEDGDLELWACLPQVAHKVGADESRRSGDEEPPEAPAHEMRGPDVQS